MVFAVLDLGDDACGLALVALVAYGAITGPVLMRLLHQPIPAA